MTFANAIALIALFVSLGGTVYAAATINGKTIRKNSIPADRVKKDSLTGVQVNEGSLATVPSATTAASATKATTAERAISAERAESAAKADSAATAGRADLASEAEHAKAADEAVEAVDAKTLSGTAPEALLRDCEDGVIKAGFIVDPRPDVPVKEVGRGEFGCGASRATVARVLDAAGRPVEGEFTVSFDDPTEGAMVNAFGFNSVASVNGPGPTFRVKIYSSRTQSLLGRERFSVVIF